MSKSKRIRANQAAQAAVAKPMEINYDLYPWLIPGGKLTQLHIDTLRKLKVAIGIPMYGGLCYGAFAMSLAQLHVFADRIGMQLVVQTLFNESLIQRGRNAITHLALKQDPDYLLFIDSDIGFAPLQVLEMILCAELNKEPLVGATYSKKEINWEKVVKHVANGVHHQWLQHCAGSHVIIPKNSDSTFVEFFKPFPVKHLGTGFMLISREAFAKIKPASKIYNNNHIPYTPFGEQVIAYFDCEIRNEPDAKQDIYMSEDYLFCARAADAGITPKLMPWINLVHYGTIPFDGCYVCTQEGYIHPVKEPKK